VGFAEKIESIGKFTKKYRQAAKENNKQNIQEPIRN